MLAGTGASGQGLSGGGGLAQLMLRTPCVTMSTSDVAAFYAEELSGGRVAGRIVMPFEALEGDERTAAR